MDFLRAGTQSALLILGIPAPTHDWRLADSAGALWDSWKPSDPFIGLVCSSLSAPGAAADGSYLSPSWAIAPDPMGLPGCSCLRVIGAVPPANPETL